MRKQAGELSVPPAQRRACRCTHILPSRPIVRTMYHDGRMHVHWVRPGTSSKEIQRLATTNTSLMMFIYCTFAVQDACLTKVLIGARSQSLWGGTRTCLHLWVPKGQQQTTLSSFGSHKAATQHQCPGHLSCDIAQAALGPVGSIPAPSTA